MTPEQEKLFRIVVTAILETIHAAGPSGAPAGHLYAALMTYGWTLSQFESAMAGLVRSGLVQRDAFLYFLSSAGEAVVDRSCIMNRREFLFTIGTGNGWNCHTLDGCGFRLDPVAGGEAWDWSATRGWGIGVGTGQAESRDAAVDAAVESLAEAGVNVENLPMRD